MKIMVNDLLALVAAAGLCVCLVGAILLASCDASSTRAETIPCFSDVRERVDADLARGEAIVVHVVVALCDNIHQGIVPVSKELGNGQAPATNLYWGALYGLRTHLNRSDEFREMDAQWPVEGGVLDQVVFKASFDRPGSGPAPVQVVAEAWDGSKMEEAIETFLSYAAGHDPIHVRVNENDRQFTAGGDSSLIIFVGHNGLMDAQIENPPQANPAARPRSSVVLACASKPYFEHHLVIGGSQPLLLTTGLMAPEAYTVHAIIETFAAGGNPASIRQSAAEAYNAYQKCGRRAALNLFACGS